MNFLKNLNKSLHVDFKLSSKNNLFRALTYKEKQAVEVFDFRDITSGDPNNNVIITCEHASNVTHKYKFPKEQEKWLDTHWGYDIGAKDMGVELSESAQCLSIYSNFSRLILDPNRSPISSTLIRKIIEKDVELAINQDEVLDEEKRIELFYLPYYRIMKETLNFIRPRYAFSVHSFTKQYEETEERQFEVGVLFRNKNILVDMLEHEYKKEGVNYRLNEPYTPHDGVCFAMDSINTWNAPEWLTDVVLLEFRNDYCSNPSWRKKQVQMLTNIIEQLKTRH